MVDEFGDEVVEVVGEPCADEEVGISRMMDATFVIMRKHPGENLGCWLRADNCVEIVPNWVVSERKRRQRNDR